MRGLRLLLICVPASIVVHLLRGGPEWVFILSCLAIVPLAGLLGMATEEFARYRGQAFGGLLNATFGNATELIIAIVALRQGEIEVVKASLIGSIVGNLLLVLGVSVLLGGFRHKIQTFNKEVAGVHAVMLAMTVVCLVVPALFVRSVAGMAESANDPRVAHLSLCVASVLLALYVFNLIFSFRTHESLFRTEEEDRTPPTWSQRATVMALLATAVAIAGESELLVGSIEPVVKTWHLSALFIGIIIVPIIGNAAEHSTAVMMAVRDKMDISLNIAFSSSTQIAMFVAPVAIFAAMALGHPMSVLFSNIELVAVIVAVFISRLITIDGQSHWLEGAQLLAAYFVIALAFYFVPG